MHLSPSSPRPQVGHAPLFSPSQIPNEERLKGKVLPSFSRKHLTLLPSLQGQGNMVWLKLSILTLYDGQEDDNYKEEESDVKNDTVDLIFVAGGIFNFIPNAPSGTNPNVHVEHVALGREREMPPLPTITSRRNVPISLPRPQALSLAPNPYSGDCEMLCCLLLFQHLSLSCRLSPHSLVG